MLLVFWLTVLAWMLIALIVLTSIKVADWLESKGYNELTQFAGYLGCIVTLTVVSTILILAGVNP